MSCSRAVLEAGTLLHAGLKCFCCSSSRVVTRWAGSDLSAEIQPSCRGGNRADGEALPPTGGLKVKGSLENMRALTVYFIVGFFTVIWV